MVARLSCILMHTGVSFSWVIWQSFFERYTCVLMETSPEFLIHFLKTYSCMTHRFGEFAAGGMNVDTGDEFTNPHLASGDATSNSRIWGLSGNSPPVSVISWATLG